MWFLTTSPVCAAGYVRKRWWQMYFIGKCFVHLNRNCINRSSFKTFSRNGFQGVAASILFEKQICSCFHTFPYFFAAASILFARILFSGKFWQIVFFLLAAIFCGRFLRNCRVKNNNWLSANRKLSSKQARNLSQVESGSVIVAIIRSVVRREMIEFTAWFPWHDWNWLSFITRTFLFVSWSLIERIA